MADDPGNLAELLAETVRHCYARGWALGTSGNFSVVLSREPLHLLITPSGVDKGGLTAEQLVAVDAKGKLHADSHRPSDETLLHLAVVRARRAGAVLHTHSVWSTILSQRFAPEKGFSITGYEMLKGLQDVRTHTHREWLPILENSQDIPALAAQVENMLEENPAAHGFLLRGHGLYTWGESLSQAKRHLEILEFLLEVVGRQQASVGG